jgi:hypothetical protein
MQIGIGIHERTAMKSRSRLTREESRGVMRLRLTEAAKLVFDRMTAPKIFH